MWNDYESWVIIGDSMTLLNIREKLGSSGHYVGGVDLLDQGLTKTVKRSYSLSNTRQLVVTLYNRYALQELTDILQLFDLYSTDIKPELMRSNNYQVVTKLWRLKNTRIDYTE